MFTQNAGGVQKTQKEPDAGLALDSKEPTGRS